MSAATLVPLTEVRETVAPADDGAQLDRLEAKLDVLLDIAGQLQAAAAAMEQLTANPSGMMGALGAMFAGGR